MLRLLCACGFLSVLPGCVTGSDAPRADAMEQVMGGRLVTGPEATLAAAVADDIAHSSHGLGAIFGDGVVEIRGHGPELQNIETALGLGSEDAEPLLRNFKIVVNGHAATTLRAPVEIRTHEMMYILTPVAARPGRVTLRIRRLKDHRRAYDRELAIYESVAPHEGAKLRAQIDGVTAQ